MSCQLCHKGPLHMRFICIRNIHTDTLSHIHSYEIGLIGLLAFMNAQETKLLYDHVLERFNFNIALNRQSARVAFLYESRRVTFYG